MRRRNIEEWRREVFRSQSPDMTAATKVLCLYLADQASKTNLHISVPREVIAEGLGVHKARVAERIARAVSAGFLTSMAKGYPGHTAVYRATFPDQLETRSRVQQSGTQLVTAPSDASGYAERYPFPRSMVTAPQDAITTADLYEAGDHRNVSNNEHEGCRWPGHARCPGDCGGYQAAGEESA